MTSPFRCALALVAALAASAALAQPKPALVQDRDEPGRNPWQQSVEVVQNTTNCGPPLLLCVCNFDAVPAGKRLVVTHASAILHTDAATSDPLVYAGAAQVPPFAHMLPLPQARGGTRHVTTAPTHFVVEPGQAPYVIVQASPLSDGPKASCALSGYFVTLP